MTYPTKVSATNTTNTAVEYTVAYSNGSTTTGSTTTNSWYDSIQEEPYMKKRRIERTLEALDPESFESLLLNILQDALLDEEEITENSLADLSKLIVSSLMVEFKEQLVEATDIEEASRDKLKAMQRERQVNQMKHNPHGVGYSDEYKKRANDIYRSVHDKDQM
jgi:hypothetical protein